jgi:hypothetical protein
MNEIKRMQELAGIVEIKINDPILGVTPEGWETTNEFDYDPYYNNPNQYKIINTFVRDKDNNKTLIRIVQDENSQYLLNVVDSDALHFYEKVEPSSYTQAFEDVKKMIKWLDERW